MTGTGLLDVRDLAVGYHTGTDVVRAVRGVSFSLGAGQTLAIAGESGSGKSTVAQALLRLLPRSSDITGEILFHGEDVLTARWGRMRAIRWAGASVVFQGAMSALNPVRTIGDQIAEPVLLHDTSDKRAAAARAAELLDSVGVAAKRRSLYPHELSGGQRQRVMIAMALACRPDLIIADEPTTALDVMVQAQILDLLAGIVAERDIGLIMISHDLPVLAENCTSMAVMYAGRIVETGPAWQLLTEPRHPYTRALSGAAPRIGDPASRFAPTSLAGDPPDLREDPPGCPFRPRCVDAVEACATRDVELWPADPGRHSACLRVLPEFAAPPEERSLR